MYYVFSTLTNSNDFAIYANNGDKAPGLVLKKITIKGGHLLAKATPGMGVYTSQGVVTEVSDEDMELLEKEVSFQNHVKDGYLVVMKHSAKPEIVTKDMTEKDGSSQKTPKDYEAKSGETVIKSRRKKDD